MTNTKLNQFLLNASNEEIVKLTRGIKPIIPIVYNNIWQKNTIPNSNERLHIIEYCNIIEKIDNIKANNSIIRFNFYLGNDDYNNEIYHSNYSIKGRQYIHQILKNCWDYINKDNLHLIFTKDLFNVDLYKHYKFFTKKEHLENLYISYIKLDKNINNDNVELHCKIILKK